MREGYVFSLSVPGGGHPLKFQILPQYVTYDRGVERGGGISVQIPDFFWKKVKGGAFLLVGVGGTLWRSVLLKANFNFNTFYILISNLTIIYKNIEKHQIKFIQFLKIN